MADVVILTEEDYRDEDPVKIAREVAVGLEKIGFSYVQSSDKTGLDSPKHYTIEVDRKKAIELALSITKPGDVLILTGKGHEKSLARGTVETPWDEVKIVTTLLHEKANKGAK